MSLKWRIVLIVFTSLKCSKAVAEFSTALRKSLCPAGSAINRTVSFCFLTFIYDRPHILHSIDLDLYSCIFHSDSYKIAILFIGYNGNTRLDYIKSLHCGFVTASYVHINNT